MTRARVCGSGRATFGLALGLRSLIFQMKIKSLAVYFKESIFMEPKWLSHTMCKSRVLVSLYYWPICKKKIMNSFSLL